MISTIEWLIVNLTLNSLDQLFPTWSLLVIFAVQVKSAQKFLGHSDIEVTLEVYTHLSKFKEDKAIRALDEHLKERKKEPEIRLLRALWECYFSKSAVKMQSNPVFERKSTHIFLHIQSSIYSHPLEKSTYQTTRNKETWKPRKRSVFGAFMACLTRFERAAFRVGV